MRQTCYQAVRYLWSRVTIAHLFLLPLSALFALALWFRKQILLMLQTKVAAPLIIVGNITAGGNGKTTFVIGLVNHLMQRGYRVGVITRGYGRRYPTSTIVVNHNMDPEIIGDEARLIWNRTKAPLCVSPDRIAAANTLISLGCELIVSDDGMQNYALYRDIEITLLSQASLGNGFLMPAGPLRELPSRIKNSDFRIYLNDATEAGREQHNQIVMQYTIEQIVSMDGSRQFSVADWPLSKKIHAICAIGNPHGFFNLLKAHAFTIEQKILPDHDPIDIKYIPSATVPVFITEKDAMKNSAELIKHDNIWVVIVEPKFNCTIYDQVFARLRGSDQLSEFPDVSSRTQA